MMEPVIAKRAVWRSLIVSALMIVAGILAIFVPQAAGIAVNLMVGWLLLFSGAAHFFYAWSERRDGGLLWGVLLGVLYVVVGAYLLLNPIVGLMSLTLALAMYLFAEAALEFILSFELRHRPSSGWLLLHGIITVILAAMITATWPFSTEWAIGTLIGVSILFSGITRFELSLAARRMMKPALR